MAIKNNKIYIAIILGLLGSYGFSQTPPRGALGSCKISPLVDAIQPESIDLDNETMYVSALYADSDQSNATLRGDVTVYQNDAKVQADFLSLDRKNNILSGKDQEIRYADQGAVLTANSFTSYIDDQKYEGENAVYYLKDQSAQGKAKSIVRFQNEKKTDLQEVTYSTCPTDQEAWQISAQEMHIDQNIGRGVARNAKFSLFGVPVLYTPYISFPTDDRRQTGFLFPIVSMDNKGGFSLRTPYYLNIAPNFDMTLTPGFYTKRGVILGAEARYLNKWQSSVLSFEVLPSDRAFRKSENLRVQQAIEYNVDNDIWWQNYPKQRSDTRWAVFFEQSMNLMPKLNGHVLFQQNSDTDYSSDIQDAIGLLSQTSLERLAEFSYKEQNWETMLRFQHFQVLDKTVIPEKPYARMPQLTFRGEWETSSGFRYGVSAEAVRFSTSVDLNNPLRPKIGNRIDLMPYVAYRFENSWGFFEPFLAYRYTYYDLKYERFNFARQQLFRSLNGRNLAYEMDQLSGSLHRALPIFSVDTGLFFERNTQFKSLFGGGNFVQTLEPRLFYLYVPYRNQSDIPIFDTGTVTPSYNNLFARSNFTGADRQNNANQLTTALTTRFLSEETGEEYFRFSAGQIYYFTETRTTLGKDAETYNQCISRKYSGGQDNLDIKCERRNRSEWFAESSVRLTSDINAKATWQWSPKLKKTTRLAFDLRYQPNSRQVINIGHRYSRDPNDVTNVLTHQIDLTSFWEINNNWAVVGRYNYSLESHRLSDSYLGFEYNDCCIATRFAARYYRDNLQTNKKEWKAYLQFELKGLGNFGQDTNSLWGETINGYTPRLLSNGSF